MEKAGDKLPDASNMAPSTHPTTVRQTITSPCICAVCGGVAQYSYYGAIVCSSCKVFFRRNAQTQPSPLKCNSGDHCEININNRRICSSCRLAKCFASGMNVEMIRASRTKQPVRIPKKKSQSNSTSTALVKLPERYQPPQIRTLNLLQADQSTLNRDHWNHLSNLVHCFDEYSGLPFIEKYIDKQNALPPKFRFKHASVNAFFTSMMSQVQLVFEKNRDFFPLSSHDRSTLLHTTVEYTAAFGGAFLLRQTHLLDRPDFSRSAELVFGSSAISTVKRLIDQFDLDSIFIKILFAIMSFLISNYTVYTENAPTHLIDSKAIIRVQDIYTELAWRYLVYKHNDHDAVLCFTNFIRCIFLLTTSVVQTHEERQPRDIIHSVVKSIEEKLTLNS